MKIAENGKSYKAHEEPHHGGDGRVCRH